MAPAFVFPMSFVIVIEKSGRRSTRRQWERYLGEIVGVSWFCSKAVLAIEFPAGRDYAMR